MADLILNELVEAMHEQFPGADKGQLSTRLVVAINEADRLLTRQQPRAALAAQPQAPAPASDTPLDLDALLSPEGAYARGDGTMDGAQFIGGLMGFVNGHGWWEPQHGCDTLDVLLCRIRARIMPHLRPPIAGIDVPGLDGDYGNLLDLCAAEGVDPRIGAPLLKRAREAWGRRAAPPTPSLAEDRVGPVG
jgi:hypothetical protein